MVRVGLIELAAAPKGAKLLVFGGRFYARLIGTNDKWAARQDKARVERDRIRLYNVLDALEPSGIAHGAAEGADTLAGEWAAERGVPCEAYPAYWRAEGRRAGPKRNRRMFVDFCPDGAVGFPGGSGTADMASVVLESKSAWLVRIKR